MSTTEIEGTHPYQRLWEDDNVYKYEKFLRLQSRTCGGQRFTAICILASTITLIVILLCLFGGSDDLRDGNIPNSFFDISANTTCGRVQGEAIGDGFVFKGIPYALPPTGKKRWRPSDLLSKHKGCWHGEWDKKTFGNKCLQQNPLTRKVEGDENCLFLNIWTPTLDTTSGLSVVVYIHGGDFKWGSGHDLGLSPDIIAAHEYNIIIVTFNYRLSVFGFLALDLPSDNNSGLQIGGNYGLHDQIVALKWVQQNIKNFGGDPDSVTLLGQGSGAAYALALLKSTAAVGLFQRLWLSSPKLVNYRTLKESKGYFEHFLHLTNCSSLDCLWKLEPEEIFNFYLDSQEEGNNSSDMNFVIIDGDILSDKMQDFGKNYFINDVPVLIGSTAQEYQEIELELDSYSWNISQFKDYAEKLPNFIRPNNSDLLAHLYYNQSNPQLSILTAISDKKAVCPTNILANLIDQPKIHLSPVYRYIVTGQMSQVIQLPFTQRLAEYSFPRIDMIAFFGLLRHYIIEPSENDYKFEEQIQSMAIDFIKCGSMQLSSWKPYPKKLALISSQIDLVPHYHQQECQFWKHVAVV